MNDDTNFKPSASGTTCRIAPPADASFDEEAFLLREMAEAKAALRRTAGMVKDLARHELQPQRILRRHPLAAAGALGLSGLLIARKFLRARAPQVRAQPRPAEPAAKAGLAAMLLPSIVAVIQSLAASKLTNAAPSASNPQAWIANALWGLARDRFQKRRSNSSPSPAAPDGERVGPSKAKSDPPSRARFRPR